jgi:hypothetical protein
MQQGGDGKPPPYVAGKILAKKTRVSQESSRSWP